MLMQTKTASEQKKFKDPGARSELNRAPGFDLWYIHTRGTWTIHAAQESTEEYYAKRKSKDIRDFRAVLQ
jgi:hypothetical protein